MFFELSSKLDFLGFLHVLPLLFMVKFIAHFIILKHCLLVLYHIFYMMFNRQFLYDKKACIFPDTGLKA